MNILSFFKREPMTKLAVGVVLSATAFSCIQTPLEPIMPASNIQMSIPIIDRTRTVADLFSKDTSVVKQNGAGYYYEDDRTFSPTGIDSIKVTPQSSMNQVSVGKLNVPGLPTQSSSITADKIFPTASFPLNWPGPPLPGIPAGNITVAGASMQDTVDFDFLRIASGTMSVTVKNTLPMTVTFSKPLVLRNNKMTAPVDTSVVASFALDSVTTGQTKTVTFNLAGVMMRGALQTDSIRVSTASKQGPFTINSTDGISFGFGTTSLDVDSAAAKIPQQNLISVNDSTITLDSTAVLQQALFSKGIFKLDVNNQTGLQVGARLKFSNFVRAVSPYDTLTIDTVLTAHQNFSFPVNLANYRVVNGTQGILGGTSLKFSVGIRTVNSGNNKATVTYKDFVQASFLPQQELVLKSLTGVMNPLRADINTGVSLAGLGNASDKLSGSFSYDSIQIKLKFGISGGFPIYHNLKLFTVNRKVVPNKLDSLTVPSGFVQPGLATPGVITLGNAEGLSAFLGQATSSLPDTMYVRGYVVIDSTKQSGTIYDTTKVYPSLSTIIPMKLGLLGGQYADVIEVGGKFDSSFVADVVKGTLYFSITNGLPITLSFRAAFLGLNSITHRQDTLLAVPVGGGGSTYTVSGATVDGSGAVSAPRTSTFSIGLVQQQILALDASDSVFVKLTVSTSGATTPTVQAVRIRSTDYINIRASANMVYTVNKKK